MRYPVAVWVDHGIYSAEVPNLPGVITEADSLDELEQMVVDGSSTWMEAELADGRVISSPPKIENLLSDEFSQDGTWMLVDIDINKLSEKSERLNICTLHRRDLLASLAGESRSDFLAKTNYSLSS